jgi:hypothetical protein
MKNDTSTIQEKVCGGNMGQLSGAVVTKAVSRQCVAEAVDGGACGQPSAQYQQRLR